MKIGDEVWAYTPPERPRAGRITEFLAFGIRVETDDRMARNHVYAKHRVFARPAGRAHLVATMRDDADSLERYAKELEAECLNEKS